MRSRQLPLDPAALEELSVTYMFETKEGAEDMSPFALAVNMVMAIGSYRSVLFHSQI